jgi:hypothetical protein
MRHGLGPRQADVIAESMLARYSDALMKITFYMDAHP